MTWEENPAEEPAVIDYLPKVFLGQLPKEWTADLVRQLLADVCEIVPYSVKAHERRTCCFVQFCSMEEAIWAMALLNRRVLFDYAGAYWYAPDEHATNMLNAYVGELKDTLRGSGLPCNTLVAEPAAVPEPHHSH